MEKVSSVVERIIASAMEVLATKTISGTRMHLIAEQAQMGASNIHYYFKTKKDLLYEVLSEIQHRSTVRRERIMAKVEPTLKGKLSGFFISKETMIKQDRDADIIQFDFWVQGLAADVELKQRFQDSFGIWRSDIMQVLDEFSPALPKEKKELITYIMVSMLMGASMQYYYNPQALDLTAYFSTCLDMILGLIDAQ